MNVGELRAAIASLPDDMEVILEGDDYEQNPLLRMPVCRQVAAEGANTDEQFYVTDEYVEENGEEEKFLTADKPALLLSPNATYHS